MKRGLVVAVDMGYRNFAWIAIDEASWRAPLHWYHEDWWPHRDGKPSRDQLMDMCDEWLARNEEILARAETIVLERQLKLNFVAMNAFIASRYWRKVNIVSANTVGAFWKLPRRRRDKKPAGVRRVKEFGVAFPRGRHKSDDLADVWLMAMHSLIESRRIPRDELRANAARAKCQTQPSRAETPAPNAVITTVNAA